ncbi:MAG: MFS transporter [Rickettsiaceae bacterium]|nr:MFS transporter [Rickettsiaceae bacterium]
MLKENKFSAQGIFIWLICALFFLYEFLLRTVLGTFQKPIMSDFELTTIEFSMVSSTVYLLIYSFMQIPVGLIVDHFGLKKPLLAGALICSVSIIGFSFSQTMGWAIFFRALMGLGSSFGFVCLLISVYDWLPKKHLAFMVGASQFIGTMGPMMAAGPLESISEQGSTGWREIFFILGVVGFLISALVFLFVKNNQEKAGSFKILKRPESIHKTFSVLFFNTQAWSIALFSGLVYFSLEYLSENEGKDFIILKGHTNNFASYMITLAWFGYAIGCPITGFLSDRLQRRRPFLIINAFLALFGLILVVYTTQKYFIILGALCLGVGASGQSNCFALMAEQFKKAYLAAALSLNNTLTMFFSAINAPVLSVFIDQSRRETIVPDISNYDVAFTLLIALVALSLIFPIFFIKESYCKSKADFTIL